MPSVIPCCASGWRSVSGASMASRSPAEQTYVSIGGLDAMDKSLRALNMHFRRSMAGRWALPSRRPGFAVCLWQAESLGMEMINFHTAEADHFKLTAPALTHLLADAPQPPRALPHRQQQPHRLLLHPRRTARRARCAARLGPRSGRAGRPGLYRHRRPRRRPRAHGRLQRPRRPQLVPSSSAACPKSIR